MVMKYCSSAYTQRIPPLHVRFRVAHYLLAIRYASSQHPTPRPIDLGSTRRIPLLSPRKLSPLPLNSPSATPNIIQSPYCDAFAASTGGFVQVAVSRPHQAYFSAGPQFPSKCALPIQH
jgi:hypothetical protein